MMDDDKIENKDSLTFQPQYYDSDSSSCDLNSSFHSSTQASTSPPDERESTQKTAKDYSLAGTTMSSSFSSSTSLDDESTKIVQLINATCQNKAELCLYKHTLTSPSSSHDDQEDREKDDCAEETIDNTDEPSVEENDLNVSEIASDADSMSVCTPLQQKVDAQSERESESLLKVSLMQSDIYPSLKLTLSDQPIKEIRARAGSCPSSKDLEPGLNRTSSPMRRQISLSLTIPPQSPIPVAKNILTKRSKQARDVLKLQNAKLQTRIKKFRQKRKLKRERKLQEKRKLLEQKRSRIIVIPSNHRLKILWDVLTVLVTIVSAAQLHTYIRDRSTYEYDAFLIFTNIWFGIDLLLNFITDHRTSDGTVIKTGREVWGRYLTTWFAVDALSLLPWERMFIRPIIIMQNRRNIVTKWFLRSKGVIKVTRFLGRRKYCIKYFGKLSKVTKKAGVGANRLIRILIKYIPKYLLFYRNMKGVLLLKTLRQVHYVRKLSRSLTSKYEDDKEIEQELIDNDDDDDDLSVCSIELQSLVEKLDGIQEIGDDDDDDDDPLINYDLRLNLSMDDERLSKHRDDLIEHCSLSLHEHDDIQEHHEEYHFEEQFDQKEQPIVSQELNSL